MHHRNVCSPTIPRKRPTIFCDLKYAVIVQGRSINKWIFHRHTYENNLGSTPPVSYITKLDVVVG